MQTIIEIRNTDGRLVGKYAPDSSTLEIMIKGCLTTIRFLPDGKIELNNTKPERRPSTQFNC